MDERVNITYLVHTSNKNNNKIAATTQKWSSRHPCEQDSLKVGKLSYIKNKTMHHFVFVSV